MKRFERSNGLDTALYKNYFFFYTKLYIASITKSYSKRIHVVPTFNFTIDGTVPVFIVSGNNYYNFQNKFLNNMLYLSSLFL